MLRKVTTVLSISLLIGCGGGGSSSSGGASSNSSSGGSSSTSSSSSSASSSSSSSSTSGAAQALPATDRVLAFRTRDPGEDKSIELWGLDTAWVSETNIRRGIAFMGRAQVDLVRVSFTPTAALVNGNLQREQADLLAQRLDYVDLVGTDTPVVLNADPPTVDPWFKNGDGSTHASRWAQLMDVTAARCEARGHEVLAAAPFNEPDYATHQGGQRDFYDVAGALVQLPRFADVRITGGNTLSADAAASWYRFLKDRLDEGNTHQLNGSFANYAGFFQTVVDSGDRAVNDELHNVMEAIVGAEYGMSTGIWWGTAERARGEFVRASDGQRLGYAEHRPNWTAAAVYRTPQGRIQAFGGASERQATTTTYRLVAKDRAVFFNGQGPQHEYVMTIPGGTGYWENQPNAEVVVDITWGDDVPPAINGRYTLVNRNSHKVLETPEFDSRDGANLLQGEFTGEWNQQWVFTPLDPRNGQDFSYYHVSNFAYDNSPDVYNHGLEDGVAIVQWQDLNAPNQHWYLNYAGDGWFHICSRISAKCLEVDDGSTSDGAYIHQATKSGKPEQQWRFQAPQAQFTFEPPEPPTQLQARAHSAAIHLHWTASASRNLDGYTVLRRSSEVEGYEVIARDLHQTQYVDNAAVQGVTNSYVVRAVDLSGNVSRNSGAAGAQFTPADNLLAHLPLDGDFGDVTGNAFHGKIGGTVNFTNGRLGSAADLNGTDNFIQLPAHIADAQAITVAAWVYWRGGPVWQRIFDFGNGEQENMFLTPSSDGGTLRFAINAGEGEQRLETSEMATGQWTHLAVVLGADDARMYVNGQLADAAGAVTLRPNGFKPVLNYIGKSQFPDPLFNGIIDDFRVYNHALSEAQVQALGRP